MRKKTSRIVFGSVLAVTVILVAALAMVVNIDQERKANEIAMYRQFFQLETERLADRFEDLTSLNGVVINDPVILNCLSRYRQGQGPTRISMAMTNKILSNIARIDHLLAAYLMDGKGNCLFSSQREFIGRNYAFRPYFIQALKQGKAVYVARGVTSGQIGIYFSRLIRLHGDILGVAVLKLEPDFFDITPVFSLSRHQVNKKDILRVGLVTGEDIFFDIPHHSLNTLSRFTPQRIAQIRESRQFPAHSIRSLAFPPDTWQRLKRAGFLVAASGGRDYYLFAEPLAGTGLSLLHVVERNWFHQNYRHRLGFYNGLLLVFGCMLIVACLLVFFLDRRHHTLLQQSRDLAESEGKLKLFSQAVEQSGSSMLITDKDGTIIYVNPYFSDVTGYSREEVIGENPRLLKSGVQDDTVYEDLWQTISSGRRWKGILCNRKKNGELFWEEATISPILNESNEISHFIAIKEDITEQRVISRQLDEETEKLQFVVEHAGFGIAFIVNRRFAWVNQSGVEIFGYQTTDEVLNQPTEMIYPDMEVYRAVGAWFLDPANKGRTLKKELELQKKDGSLFWASVTGKALDSDDPHRGIIWIVEDITRRKKHEEQLLRAQREAEAASEMKSRLLANISHDIRTPLHGIMGTFDLMQNMSLDTRLRRLVVTGSRAADFLLNLLNNLLDLSKIEAGQLVLDEFPFSIRELILDVADILSSQFSKKGISFQYSVGDEVPGVLMADALRIKQILINLTGNSLKFTRRGTISVTVSSSPRGDDSVMLLCRVRDTGEGIAPEQQERLFEAFIQADSSMTRRSAGTGLGLSICKELCTLMGGRIWFESEPGQGSTFSFTIVCGIATEKQQRHGAATDQHASWQGSVFRILVVDDNEANQEILRMVLEQDGHRVTVAANGLQALQALTNTGFDLIFMDMQMPVMDGITATRIIRHCEQETLSPLSSVEQKHAAVIHALHEQIQGTRIPIIALTANAMQDDKIRCQQAGMDNYLAKPFQKDQLLHVLMEFTGSGLPEEAEVTEEAGEQRGRVSMVSIREYLQAQYPFSEEQITTLIKTTLAGLARDFDRLAAAARDGQDDQVADIAHKVKGSLLNLGMEQLARKTTEIEQAAKDSSLEQYRRLIAALADEWELFCRSTAEEREEQSSVP